MLSSPTRSLPYCLGGLKTIHGRYVVDGRLFVGREEQTEEPPHGHDPIVLAATHDMTVLSIIGRSRTSLGLAATSRRNHPSQPSQLSQPALDATAVETSAFRETRNPKGVIQFRTHEHPRERGGRLFHSLGVGITELLERCIVRQGSLCIIEPVQADWGGFPTATLLMLLGVPAPGAAAALAEAFAPLDRQESLRRQMKLTELLTEMEQTYGSSVRFALAHGSDASLLGNLRFCYLAR
jgi:hypothetical protein